MGCIQFSVVNVSVTAMQLCIVNEKINICVKSYIYITVSHKMIIQELNNLF